MAKVGFTKPGAEALSSSTTAPAAQTPVVPTGAEVAAPVAATPISAAAPVVPTGAATAVVDVVAVVQPVIEAAAIAPAAAPAPTTAAPALAPTAPAAQVTVTPSPGLPAVIPATEVPATTSGGFFDDESIDADDLVLPRLNIVQKVGELSNLFPPGSILLNSELVLANAPKPNADSDPIRFLVIGFKRKQFVEKVEGGLRGNVCDTEQEVVAKGGTLDYNESAATKKPLYQRLATAMILIERPAHLNENSFPIELLGKRYALALYGMKGTAYTNGAKHILSARKLSATFKGGYRCGWWTLQSKLKQFNSNFAYIPVVRPQESSTPELREALKNLIGF